MCYEAPLRCNISLREMFSKSETPRVMKKYDQSALMEISQEFETLKHVNCQARFLNTAF